MTPLGQNRRRLRNHVLPCPRPPNVHHLLGYGIGMILVRERTKNPNYKIRAILARRYVALIFVGIVHTIFLFYGDIMFNYGLIAMAIILCYNLRDKTLLWISGILWSIGLLLLSSIWLLDDTTIPASYPYENGYVTDQISIGIVMLSHVLLQYGINLVSIGPVMLLGFIAGCRSVLEHPYDYARYMRIAATINVLIILSVGIPWGLAALGILDNENFWFSINQVIGMSSGPGLVVFLSWVARWLESRNLHQTLPIRMITTLGRMSMTGYVLQSILFTIIMVPWALGIGSGAGAATVTLIAFGIWIITLVFAFLWDRTGKRGPLETIHCTLAYGRSG